MTKIKYGSVEYNVYTKAELEAMGYTKHWFMSGMFLHCVPCNSYEHMTPYSRNYGEYSIKAEQTTIYVCENCNQHHNARELK